MTVLRLCSIVSTCHQLGEEVVSVLLRMARWMQGLVPYVKPSSLADKAPEKHRYVFPIRDSGDSTADDDSSGPTEREAS